MTIEQRQGRTLRDWRLAAIAIVLLAIAASIRTRAVQFAPSAPPLLDHPSGTYADVFWLSAAGTPGAVVRFTTDGTVPDATSPVLANPMLVSRTTTVKARTFAAGTPPSDTTTNVFTIEIPVRGALSRLQVVPTTYHSSAAGFMEACLHMDQWPTVLAGTTYFGTSGGLRDMPDDQLTACFSAMRAHSLELTLGVNVVSPELPDSAAMFAIDSPAWTHDIQLGAPLGTLFMNEPLSVMGASMPYTTIVDQTASWIALVRQHFPGIALILQEAYPGQTAATIVRFVHDVNTAAIARGVAGLDGFELDQDWQVSRWSPSDIYRIHQAVRAQRMRFSIIIWPSGPPTSDDCAFGRRTYDQFVYLYTRGFLAYGQDFAPDMWTIESWDPIPAAILPESGTGCSFMQGARAIVTMGF